MLDNYLSHEECDSLIKYYKENEERLSVHLQSHTLETLKKVVLDIRPSSFEDCVTYGRLLWEEHFNTQIQHLLQKLPPDQVIKL